MVTAAFFLPWLIVGVGCWIGYQLIRQNGRLLLRLESLEKAVAQLGTPKPQVAPAQTAPTGLPIGAAAPDFELPLVSDPRARKKLSEFQPKRVLLLFFNPRCGFCTQMLPQLAVLTEHNVVPIVVTTGDPVENSALFKEHDISCTVLLQHEMETASRFLVNGTPMGYLIDEQGQIASQLAIGADALLALVGNSATSGMVAGSADNGKRTHKGNRLLSDSKIERNGLKVGIAAPGFTLPRVQGGELSVEEYWGRKLLLVFSDPDCGPCNQLAPRLEEAHRRHPEIQVLMVSRGDLAPNQAKIAEHSFTFPVVLQKQWEISRLYAMFATPIAYCIDEEGLIADEVAVGTDPILSLFAAAASSPSRINMKVQG
jgi:peroxiredoxin